MRKLLGWAMVWLVAGACAVPAAAASGGRAHHGCVRSRGASIAARDAQAAVEIVVRDKGAGTTTAWYGCVRAIGRWRLLTKEYAPPEGGPPIAWHVTRVAGRFAAFDGTHYCAKYQVVCDSGQAAVRVFNLKTGRASLSVANPCQGHAASGSLCSVQSLVVDARGFAAWRATETPYALPRLDGVSCPSSSLCAAVDGDGNVLTSTEPSGSRVAWSAEHVVSDPILSISCASTAMCAAGDNDGNVITSTDPTAGAPRWSVTRLPSTVPVSLIGISCVASTCVGVGEGSDGASYVATSSNPTGGSKAWTVSKISSGKFNSSVPRAVSCASPSLCIAVDNDDNVLSSTDPGGGAAAWHAFHLNAALTGLSCPSTSLCVATGFYAGNVVASSTDPTGGPAAWTVKPISDTPSSPFSSVSCPSTWLCAGVGDSGAAFSSTDPTGGSDAWTVVAGVDLGGSPTAISCPSRQLCVAVDSSAGFPPDGGNVLHTSDPTGGPGAWTTTFVDRPAACSQAPCRAEQIYAHDDRGTRLIDAAAPGAGEVLGDLRLAAGSVTLRWTHAGTRRQRRLR